MGIGQRRGHPPPPPPAQPPAQDGTRLDVNPFAEPVPSGPIMREPLPTPPPRPAATAQAGGSRVRSIVMTVLAIVAAALVGILVASLLAAGGDDNDGGAAPAPTDTTEQTTTEAVTTSSETSSAYEEPTSEDYQDLVRDYYGLLPGDPESAWALMTENGQQKSGGLRTYKRFWNTVRTVEVLSLSANDNEVEATLRFVTKKNRQSAETYRLTVVEQDGELMIDDYEDLGRPSGDDEDDEDG